jgi:hypothetical protein
MRRPLAAPSSPDDQGDDIDDVDGQAAFDILTIMSRLASMPQNKFLTMHELRERAERFEEPARRTKSQGTAVDPAKINRSFACGRRGGGKPLS